MVAITVILAAVIAAFVFGMAGNISKTKVVAATAQQTQADHATLTYQGGQDAATCVGIHWTSDAATVAAGFSTDVWFGTSTGTVALTVGKTGAIAATSGKDHIVGTGYFADGSQQVIYDSSL
jgi:FlaG/FlaF family flagellin (archaellin)